MPEKPECFVIAPIGAEKSEIRTRSDLILKYIIKPVAEECGYNAVRADELSEPGSITTQVINRILEAPMVVADLTGTNANVFYELAVRHAIRKPYVQIIQKGERIPFDVAGIRTIDIDHTNLESVAVAKEEMKKQMTFSASNPQKIESPISVAIDLASLTQSDNPVERQLAEVLAGLTDVKNFIDSKTEFIFDTLIELKGHLMPEESAPRSASSDDIMLALKRSLAEKKAEQPAGHQRKRK